MPDTEETAEHDWTVLQDYTCAHCATVTTFPTQPGHELARGVVWECPTCSGRNLEGGPPAPVPDAGWRLDCASCGATVNPNEVDLADDGTWTCPACSIAQRHVTVADGAISTDKTRKGN